MKLYSIKDSVAQSFSDPFSAVNDLVALRMFEVQKKKSQLPVEFFKDHDLFLVGEFFEATGKIYHASEPVLIRGASVKFDNPVLNQEQGEKILKEVSQ